MPYPGEKDVFPVYDPDAARFSPSLAGAVSRLGDVLEAVQEELGYGPNDSDKPKGSHANLVARLAAIEATLAPGIIVPFSSTVIPDGWLLCDGSAVSRTTYSALFAVIGETHGAGDGVNTFNLPDLRRRFVMGRASSGTGATIGETGGTFNHTHSGPSHTHGMATHTHSVDVPQFDSGGAKDWNTITQGGSGGANTGGHIHIVNPPSQESSGPTPATSEAGGAGDGGPGDPPWIAESYIIRTGVT